MKDTAVILVYGRNTGSIIRRDRITGFSLDKKGEKMVELTDVEQKIFDKVVAEYRKRKITHNEGFLKMIIKMGNVHGDGYKRVIRSGEDKTYLVPIEDIILHGVKATELDKYLIEEHR